MTTVTAKISRNVSKVCDPVAVRLAYAWLDINEAAKGKAWYIQAHRDLGLLPDGTFASEISFSFNPPGIETSHLRFNNPPYAVALIKELREVEKIPGELLDDSIDAALFRAAGVL